MDINQANELKSLLTQLLIFYKKFVEFEQKKFDDVSNNRLVNLDEHVKGEEVYLLKSKGLEQKRINLFESFGLSDMTVVEAIKTAPDEIKNELMSTFSELSDTILTLKEINKRCNSMIELRLHTIKKTINNIEESKNKTSKDNNKNTRSEFISRKV